MFRGLAFGFVALVAAVATYVGMQPTVARGEVLAGDVKALGIKGADGDVTCDDPVPISETGAEFHCRAGGTLLDCELKPTGLLSCRLVP